MKRGAGRTLSDYVDRLERELGKLVARAEAVARVRAALDAAIAAAVSAGKGGRLTRKRAASARLAGREAYLRAMLAHKEVEYDGVKGEWIAAQFPPRAE